MGIVSRCFDAAPSTTGSSDGGSCSGLPCSDVTSCRSKFGHCGSSSEHCNAESTWKAAGCGPVSATTTLLSSTMPSIDTTSTTSMQSPATTTTRKMDGPSGPCSGTPCSDVTLCRSKWGHCGSSVDYCNAQSTWKAA